MGSCGFLDSICISRKRNAKFSGSSYIASSHPALSGNRRKGPRCFGSTEAFQQTQREPSSWISTVAEERRECLQCKLQLHSLRLRLYCNSIDFRSNLVQLD